MRHLGLILAAAALVACTPEETTAPDAGTVIRYIKVAGKVQYHPQELKWRATLPEEQQTPPSLQGVKLNVEDALKAQSNLPALKVVENLTTTDNWKTADFVAENVDIKGTTLALVASVEKPGDSEWIFSGYGLGKPPFPEELTDLPVYVVSKPFMLKLAEALGRELPSMLDEAVILGGASDWNHQNGVAGAKLVQLLGTRVTDVTEDIYYLKDDLSGYFEERATGNTGLWVRLGKVSASPHTMLEKDATTFKQEGKKVFKDRLNGSRANTVLSVFFEDTATEPK